MSVLNPNKMLAMVLLLPSGNLAAAKIDDWVPLDAVLGGEVSVYVQPRSENRRQQRAVSAAIHIPADPDQLWEIMVDCDEAPGFVPGLRRCSVLEETPEGYGQLIEHEVKLAWFAPTVTYQFEATYQPYEQIAFRRTSGDLREMEGSWTLMEIPSGGTLVIYDVRMVPGFAVPKWMVRRSLKRSLPKVLRALRSRVTQP